MIYDKERLLKNYLQSLPEGCEGVPLATLEQRISEDLFDSKLLPFPLASALSTSGWYKHHHHTYEGSMELQARRCYCRTSSTQSCEARKDIPASSPLPQVETDYDTNSEAAFWHWVCNRRAGDDPRGDFIRDTRDLLGCGGSPNEALPMATPEARTEHVKLRTQWAAETGLHPRTG